MQNSHNRTKRPTVRNTVRNGRAMGRSTNNNKNKQNKVSQESAPVAYGFKTKVGTPKFKNSSYDSVTVSHREFVSPVLGQVAFTSKAYPINPSRDIVFNWLSRIASRYERYQFEKLKFIYEPRCATSVSGEVMLVMDFNAEDAAPSSQQNAYSYERASPASPWQRAEMEVPNSVLARRGGLFNRTGSVPSGKDVKLYDLGNLFTCVSGFTGANIPAGVLLVEYTIKLYIPQVSNDISSLLLYAASGLDKTHLFGSKSGDGHLDVTVTSGELTFLEGGSSLLSYQITGVGLAAPMVYGGTAVASFISSSINAATTEVNGKFIVTYKDGDTFTWALDAATTSVATSTVFLGAYDNSA